jgi:hypothetical protein
VEVINFGEQELNKTSRTFITIIINSWYSNFVKKLPKSFKLFFSSSVAVNEQMCRPLCMKSIEGFLDNQMILAEFSPLLR